MLRKSMALGTFARHQAVWRSSEARLSCTAVEQHCTMGMGTMPTALPLMKMTLEILQRLRLP